MSVSDSSSTTCLLFFRDTRGAMLLESERTGIVSAPNSPVAFRKESQDEKDMMIMAKCSLLMQNLINCSLGVAGSLINKRTHMRPRDLVTRSQGRRVANRRSRDFATLRPGRWVAGRTWACRGFSNVRGFADNLSLTGIIRG